jgi:hypothetical protein
MRVASLAFLLRTTTVANQILRRARSAEKVKGRANYQKGGSKCQLEAAAVISPIMDVPAGLAPGKADEYNAPFVRHLPGQ